MPQRTNVIASFANGLIKAEIDFNDANGSILRGRVINDSDDPAYLYCKLNPPISGYSLVGVDAPPHQTTEVNWPNNVIKYTWQEKDDGTANWVLIGVSIFCRWPGHS